MGVRQFSFEAYESERELEAAMGSLVITAVGPPGTASTPRVVDENRLRQIEFTARTLGFLTREQEAQVTCESDSGIITVCAETDTVTFPKSSWFARCFTLADELRADLSVTGRLKLSFIFSGILPDAEEGSYDWGL